MTDIEVINLVRDAFYNVLLVVGPVLIASLLVGLTISIFQAATSISEQTLTFVPKLIAVLIVIVIFMPFMIEVLTTFTKEIFAKIPELGRP
ncbi:MAG: flagellar biosynthesis protein FliQ [Bacteroidota bacterium]